MGIQWTIQNDRVGTCSAQFAISGGATGAPFLALRLRNTEGLDWCGQKRLQRRRRGCIIDAGQEPNMEILAQDLWRGYCEPLCRLEKRIFWDARLAANRWIRSSAGRPGNKSAWRNICQYKAQEI